MSIAFKTVLTTCVLCAAAFAAQAGQPGGFRGPDGVRQVTAAEAATLPDDTDVRLVGHVVKRIGNEKYEFRDDTGVLTVEIDDDDWDGLEVTPETRVEFFGEIDRDGEQVELDVDRVRLAQ